MIWKAAGGVKAGSGVWTLGSARPGRDVTFPSILLEMRSHQWITRRSLALHEAVAAKLVQDPGLLDLARANLRRWLRDRPIAALREWQDLLETASLQDVIAILRSPDETGVRLRQSSPFAGALTPAERQRILDAYEARRA